MGESKRTKVKSKHSSEKARDIDAYIDSLFLNISSIDRIPQHSTRSEVAYSMVSGEQSTGAEECLSNFSSLTTTHMDQYAVAIMEQYISYGYAERDKVSKTITHCINILANLWNAPSFDSVRVGTPTGSTSEAALCAGVAAWLRWRARRNAAGESIDRPNFVISQGHNSVWEKFSRIWQVEMRIVPISLESPTMEIRKVVESCDENSIMVVATMGSAVTGMSDDVEELGRQLDINYRTTAVDVPIHVDADMGGFIEPLIRPHVKWDFRVERVASINTSAHKYGLVYPSLGWVIWRDKMALPKEMIAINGEGSTTIEYEDLSTSLPIPQIMAQYYMIIKLGFDGYRAIHHNSLEVAEQIVKRVSEMPLLTLLTHRVAYPVVVWYLSEEQEKKGTWTLRDLCSAMNQYGWSVAVYRIPIGMSSKVVMRMSLRQESSIDLVNMFFDDMKQTMANFERLHVNVE